ncbi:MAG: ATP-binding protein [Chloroflexota bacterium]
MSEAKRILLVFSDEDILLLLERNILSDHKITAVQTCAEARKAITAVRPELMILGDNLKDGNFLNLADDLLEKQPTLPIILITSNENDIDAREMIHLGLVDWLILPINAEVIFSTVERGLKRAKQWKEWLQLESARITRPLRRRVDELETISKIGRSVTEQLDLDGVLTTVVDAAVSITGAEEGNILLLDEESGELYMRAAKNFQEEFVQTFRLPVDDTYAGQVMQTGKPLFMNTPDPKKIKTSYLVYSIIYVPLIFHGKPIGVLGVDNRDTSKSFSAQDITLLSTMADYAAIAIENAKLYSQTEVERHRFENILTQVEDGVIVVDDELKLQMVNRTVVSAFGLENQELIGRDFEDVFSDRDLIMAIRGESLDPQRIELRLQNKFFRVQVTSVPEVGTVLALHDISYLKELDHLKTDFVNTVSHDIRTPLTSIMGYVELIKRGGPVTEMQNEYILRVQSSVHHITSLISEVLDLGKIEVGVSDEFTSIALDPILRELLVEQTQLISENNQTLEVTLPKTLPTVFGDATQLRQMIENLLGNASKYTPKGGKITLTIQVEKEQIILQVADTGCGIPLEEQSKIFDRFYRASNVTPEVAGTGLGLAITKSVVENHRGRIWVDSMIGKGSVFTVVLPTLTREQPTPT